MDFDIIGVMKTLNFSTTPDIIHAPALANKCQSIFQHSGLGSPGVILC